MPNGSVCGFVALGLRKRKGEKQLFSSKEIPPMTTEALAKVGRNF